MPPGSRRGTLERITASSETPSPNWTLRAPPAQRRYRFPEPYVSPWSKPWTSPSKEEAAALFRRMVEADAEREHQQERRRAAAFATLGIDYPYTYDGAPFGADDFRTSA